MSQNGKGDDTRPRAISRDSYYDNYERTFGKKEEPKYDDSVLRHVFKKEDSWTYESEPGLKSPGWYFWDEAGVYAYGPYNSHDEAAEGLLDYAKQL